MLWDKKIQLAKETKSAIDPNIGATEIKEMSIEIHRMTLRYEALQKLQEKLICEMEKSIGRRSSIISRFNYNLIAGQSTRQKGREL